MAAKTKGADWMSEVSNVYEVMGHSSVRQLFIDGIKHKIQEELDAISKEIIDRALLKINTELSRISKEAAELVSVEVVQSFREMDGMRRFDIALNVLEPKIITKGTPK